MQPCTFLPAMVAEVVPCGVHFPGTPRPGIFSESAFFVLPARVAPFKDEETRRARDRVRDSAVPRLPDSWAVPATGSEHIHLKALTIVHFRVFF